MAKKNVKFVFSLAVTLVVFIVLFRNIPFVKVFNLIEKANFRIISFVVTISLFNSFFISPFRWKLILNKMGCDISWSESLLIKAGGDPIISSVPFKVGEISRVLYLKRIKNMPSSKAIFSIFIEYFLNVLAILFFILLGGIVWLFQGQSFALDRQASLFFCFLGRKKVLSENKWIDNLKTRLKTCFINREIFLNKKVLFYSFLLFFFELLCGYLIARAINADIPLFSILVYLPLVILVSSIPVAFLGLGVRESIIVLLFLKYASSEKLLALGILYSFAEYILPMLIGLSLTSLFVSRIIASKK